jgi:chromatin remodeling complex protein RSC6
MEREFRNEWQWNTSSNSSTFTRVTRRNRVAQKIMPCIQDDFSSSLARSCDIRDPDYPPRIITTDYRKNRAYKSKSRKSRRNSTEKSYETADSCEKGDMLERVRSIGSLGSAPTLVDTRDMDWKSFGEPVSPTTIASARRPSSPTLSPISPLAPCLVREVDEEDEIYPFP